MKYILAVIKCLAFLFVTLFLYSLIMLSLILSVVGFPYQRMRTSLLSAWGSATCAVLGIRISIKGDIPEPPFFLVSNHLSYIDIFVLFALVKGLFVAKADVKNWPIVGVIVSTVGLLFIDRNRKKDVLRVNERISRSVNKDQGIIVFPEGTTSPGHRVLPFKTSLFQFPAEADLPLYYAAIRYETGKRDEPAYKSVCWWGDDEFMEHFLGFLTIRRTYAEVTFGRVHADGSDRKSLADAAYREISSAFLPVIDAEWFTENHHFRPIV